MLEKKIGRPSKYGENPATGSFKMSAELYRDFKDLAFSQGVSINDLIVEYVTGLVVANKSTIEKYRRQKNSAVKATFATPSKPETSTPKKTARTPKKKKSAQVDESVTSDGGDDLKVGDGNENP